MLAVCVAPLQGQSEGALRRYFEGHTVRLQIDMPGSEQGVDRHRDPADARNRASAAQAESTSP